MALVAACGHSAGHPAAKQFALAARCGQPQEQAPGMAHRGWLPCSCSGCRHLSRATASPLASALPCGRRRQHCCTSSQPLLPSLQAAARAECTLPGQLPLLPSLQAAAGAECALRRGELPAELPPGISLPRAHTSLCDPLACSLHLPPHFQGQLYSATSTSPACAAGRVGHMGGVGVMWGWVRGWFLWRQSSVNSPAAGPVLAALPQSKLVMQDSA